MRADGVERGQKVAENIRKMLLNCDLRIVYAEGEMQLANEEYRLNSKLGGQANQRKALRAKARRDTYKIYIKTIAEVKTSVTLKLNKVLSLYTPKYKTIWWMYFIEKASIDEICTAVSYSQPNVNKIIQKLKLDLDHHYNGEALYEKRR